jgi:NADP-dependent 3-hydroxy acid dehydrogenase YdfG
MADLSGRAVIVTGASSGIGRSIALQLGTAGLDQWIVGRSEEGLQETADMIVAAGGPAPKRVALDIAQPGRLAELVTQVGREHPRLFALINNAGVMHPEPILESDPKRWRAMFDINVLAPIEGIQAAVQVMRAHGQGGHLINISSLAARTSNNSMYSASKAALESAARSLRSELERDDIRITTIVPGGFVTQLSRGFKPETVATLASNAMNMGFDLSGPCDAVIGDPAHIARIIEYVLNQPTNIHIEEIVIRPPVSIDL